MVSQSWKNNITDALRSVYVMYIEQIIDVGGEKNVKVEVDGLYV